MTVPKSFLFTQLNDKYIEWGPVTDALDPNALVIDATVTASLRRSTATDSWIFQNLSLPHVGAGVYRGLLEGSTFNPPAGSYVLVINLHTPGGGDGHWEVASSVAARYR